MKKFNEMVALDLKKHTQKKPTFYKKDGKLVPTSEDKWLDYIEWAKVLELLYANGAESVSWRSEIHKEKPNTLLIQLTIDGTDYTTDYPLIDGNKIIENPNQMDIHKSELRGFVKCVAIHTGLGLSLWMKEERQIQEVVSNEKPKVILPDARFNAAIEMIKTGELTKQDFEQTLISKGITLTDDQTIIYDKLWN